METVSFYSYKGGVGRTLLIANTAQFLAMSGRRVVALDLDLEAPGLHQKLCHRSVSARAESGQLRGAVDSLLNLLADDPQIRTLDEIAIKVDLPSGSGGSLHVIPAGSAPSQTYWSALEQLNQILRTQTRNGGLPEAVMELQSRIADELAPDFLLIDSRTGITEIGGLATSLLADRVVCLTTTAPESLEGTRVVADALRSAARLPSQQPLRIEFLITRVLSGFWPVKITRLSEELGGDAKVLPHDSGITSTERLFPGSRQGQRADVDEDREAGVGLLSATLDWIAEAFPGHKRDAETARRRMRAVHDVWRHLTQTSKHDRGWTGPRDAWPTDYLRERVRFAHGEKTRLADIAVYDSPPKDAAAEPLMIIEYVDSEDRDTVAKWWLDATRVQVVVILSGDTDRRIYSGESRYDHRVRHSDRWDIPLPRDFKALSDPTDVSIDALLNAVRRGHPEYLDRIVTEWVHCSAATLHGGAPWKPQLARRIVDELASIDDVELARRILWAASAPPHRRGMWLGDGDEWLEQQVHAELFAPLLWRLPPAASIDILQESAHRGRPIGYPSGLLAVAQLARDMLRLQYDPDATFRREGQRILDRAELPTDADPDRGLYALTPAFEHTVISFAFSSELPPLAKAPVVDVRKRRESADLGSVLSRLITSRSLVTTGLLGDYEPNLGRVVLYSQAIAECAERLSLQARHVGSVTLIHETLHALAHLGRDLDGRMWPEFALPPADQLLFEPSWFHETLTQYFTFQHIVRLGDPALLNAFEVVSSKQSACYRAWKRIRNLPIEEARNWFMSVRRGVGLAPLWLQLGD